MKIKFSDESGCESFAYVIGRLRGSVVLVRNGDVHVGGTIKNTDADEGAVTLTHTFSDHDADLVWTAAWTPGPDRVVPLDDNTIVTYL